MARQVGGLATAGALLALLSLARAAARPAVQEDLLSACASDNPYLVAALQAQAGPEGGDPRAPALAAFRDSDAESLGALRALASQAEIGTVHGLAFDPRERAVYAGAYHKRGTAFGPGGPGAVYRVDLAGGARELARLQAGPDAHDPTKDDDEAAAPLVGKVSLGDVEIDADGRRLFVANLFSQRIAVLGLPEGSVERTFAHGAAVEPWRGNARLFGLAWHEGRLYHGVVDGRERQTDEGSLSAYVYRSRADGSEMTRVAQVRLDYDRSVSWGVWRDPPVPFSAAPEGRLGPAQPMLTDLAFDGQGNLAIGLRDRWTDMIPAFKTSPTGAATRYGAGDLLFGVRRADDDFLVLSAPERFDDDLGVPEATWGGLARLARLDVLVAGALGPRSEGDLGAVWLDVFDGRALRIERLGGVSSVTGRGWPLGVGDLEALCDDAAVPPELPGTATRSAQGTATSVAGTATSAAATLTAMPTGTPDDPAFVIPRACGGDNPFVGTTCYPASFFVAGLTGPAVVALRDTPSDAPALVLATGDQVGTVYGLAYDPEEQALFASAFHKRLSYFGPEGPGAVYRIGLDGRVDLLADLPGVGPDRHEPPAQGSDDSRARRWVGKTSLGDLELEPRSGDLFVVNLDLRRIQRVDRSGRVVADFAHGAISQTWAAEARPFGLGLRGDRLYHGVVRSGETSGRADRLSGHVYESALDGTEMREVLAFPLGYPRGTITVPGVLNNGDVRLRLEWRPWEDDYRDLAQGGARVAVYPQPILADIVFDAAGRMIVGLKDRMADQGVGFQVQQGARIEKPAQGIGDILRALPDGDRWRLEDDPEPFDDAGTAADEGALGGLAFLDGLDQVVTGFVDARFLPGQVGAFGSSALWLDAGGGFKLRRETTCAGRLMTVPPTSTPSPLDLAVRAALAPQHSEWIPAAANGDFERLCGPTPTPSATPSATPSPRATPTPSATPSATASPSPTATRVPGPIYLPIAVAETCDPTRLRADVVLVVDASTSMLRPTRSGRSKLAAAQEAARAFVGLLDLATGPDAPGDRVALVLFNDRAWTEAPLAGAEGDIVAAIDTLPARVAQGTRLDRALREAERALSSPARRAENQAVAILLTDGLPNRVPTPEGGGRAEDSVLDAARGLKSSGARVYTIGLGRPDAPDPIDRINADLLRAVASAPDQYFETADAEDLAAIYAEIAADIPCPPEDFWPRARPTPTP